MSISHNNQSTLLITLEYVQYNDLFPDEPTTPALLVFSCPRGSEVLFFLIQPRGKKPKPHDPCVPRFGGEVFLCCVFPDRGNPAPPPCLAEH